jgi:ADP-ribose pyrophosphatase YjhB (NUDIX family)
MQSEQQLQDIGKVHLCVEVYVLYRGKVLMHRRSQDKPNFPGFLVPPGGHVNQGEDVETGIEVPPTLMKLKSVLTHHHLDTQSLWVVWGFLAQPESLTTEIVHSDEGQSMWMDYDELLANASTTFPPAQESLEHVLTDTPGILYSSSEWQAGGGKRTRLISRTIA